MADGRKKVAILGSGNIGTDLMIKLMNSARLQLAAVAGIDRQSEGLARAARLAVATTSEGIRGLCALQEFKGVDLVFDATSAASHKEHHSILTPLGVRVVDLTPAAIGPRVVPVVNLEAHKEAKAVNMVTCGGQATIPMVAAVSRATRVHYAEVVCSIASQSAGPGTRANIDEFTETTARALRDLGGALQGKAIIVLNPAEPPLLMRNTIFCLVDADADRMLISESVTQMAQRVRAYVPGYKLKQSVQFDELTVSEPGREPTLTMDSLKVSIFLEVSGAGHYLPTYAGNLDIMTSAAIATAEMLLA